jgi:hypothetical protein
MKTVAILLLLLLVACDPAKEPVDHNTETFRFYLREAFGDSIPQEKHTFIMIPETGCKGCREGAMHVLHDEVVKTGSAGITYVLSPAVLLDDSLIRPCELLRDTSGLIDEVNLPLSNISFVKTENGKVLSIVNVRSEITDSIGYLLRK